MVDLTKLKQVRNGYRFNAKKAINSIKDLLENLEPSMGDKLIAYKATLTEKLEVLQPVRFACAYERGYCKYRINF